VPIGFTELPQVFGGRFKTVPVIEHGVIMLAESWDIVDYLERTFPGRPALFSGAAEYAMVRLMDTWSTAEILRKMLRLYALDVHNAARPEDRSYFRQSREARLNGISLEEFTAGRTSVLPAFREARFLKSRKSDRRYRSRDAGMLRAKRHRDATMGLQGGEPLELWAGQRELVDRSLRDEAPFLHD